MAMSALGDRDRSGGPVDGDAEAGGSSALAVVPPRGRAAGVRPPAADGEWQDWPDEVWADLEGREDPVTWNMAQTMASRKCRELRVPYGRESQGRARKFEALVSDRFGPGWRIAAQRHEILTRQRLELKRSEMEAQLEAEFDVGSEGRGGPLVAAAAAGAEVGLEELGNRGTPAMPVPTGFGPRTPERPGPPREREDFGVYASPGQSTAGLLEDIRERAGVRYGEAFSETSSHHDLRLNAEAEVLLSRGRPMEAGEQHVRVQNSIRLIIRRYQSVRPTPVMDLGAWAAVQAYADRRGLDDTLQGFEDRLRAYAGLAQGAGVEVPVQELLF